MKKLFCLIAVVGVALTAGCRYEEHERVVEKSSHTDHEPADRVDVHVHDR